MPVLRKSSVQCRLTFLTRLDRKSSEQTRDAVIQKLDGMVRKYFPKGTDFSMIPAEQVALLHLLLEYGRAKTAH